MRCVGPTTALVVALVSVCGALSVPGDEALAQAFDAALLELVAEGAIENILRSHNIAPSHYLQDCSPTPTYFAYPNVDIAKNATVLAQVLNSGRFRITSRRLSKSAQGDYTKTPPSGISPDIERAVVERIGKHYGRPLVAEFVLQCALITFTTATNLPFHFISFLFFSLFAKQHTHSHLWAHWMCN